MITTRAEYLFAEPEASIQIDGGLMPLRQDKNVLRGEDAAFIREAACRTAWLLQSSTTNPSWDSFLSNDLWPGCGKLCGGRCTNAILAEPLSSAAVSFETNASFFATGFMTASSIVRDTPTTWGMDPELHTSGRLPLFIGKAIQNPIITSGFASRFSSGAPLVQQDILTMISATQQLSTVTRLATVVQPNLTGESNIWQCQILPTYQYDYSSSSWQMSRSRYNLEAIHSECIHYPESGGWASFNGYRTQVWNYNRQSEWYVSLYAPNASGMQWEDRDGVVHPADASLISALVETSMSEVQAVAEFKVDEQVVVNDSDGNPKSQMSLTKHVLVPIAASRDLSLGSHDLNTQQLYDAAWTALAAAGAQIMNYQALQAQGMGSEDYGGGTTDVALEAIHGIWNMTSGLKINGMQL